MGPAQNSTSLSVGHADCSARARRGYLQSEDGQRAETVTARMTRRLGRALLQRMAVKRVAYLPLSRRLAARDCRPGRVVKHVKYVNHLHGSDKKKVCARQMYKQLLSMV